MRPTIDLAYRARNWFWYWQVRKVSGLSNDQLDRKCFGEMGRRRHFEQIQASASAPNEVALVNGQTLLTLVDSLDRPSISEPGPYEVATQAFHSQLWFFLATRDLPPSVYTEFIQQYAENRGWLRISNRDRYLYAEFLGTDEPAIESGVSTAYSAMLHKLVNDRSPDSIAVLIALFKEAMNRVDLEQASTIRVAIRASIAWMGECLELKGDSLSLLGRLVNDRILRNRWISEADWRRATNTTRKTTISSRQRIRDFQSWVAWYTGQNRVLDENIHGLYPLVPRSERIDWLETNRNHISAALEQVNYLRTMRSQFIESESLEYRQIAEIIRIEEIELLSQIQAPDSEPERLYTSRPDLILNELPCPYPTIETS